MYLFELLSELWLYLLSTDAVSTQDTDWEYLLCLKKNTHLGLSIHKNINNLIFKMLRNNKYEYFHAQ